MTILDNRPDTESTTIDEGTPQHRRVPEPQPLTPAAPARSGVSKILIALASFFFAMMLAVVAFVAYQAGNIVDAIPTPADLAAAFEPEPFVDVGPVVVSSVQDLGALTTVETVQTAVVDQGTDEGWLAWARGDSLRMIAVAKIGAGVDIAGLTPGDFSVTDDGVVTVDLPSAEIQYVAVDNEATQIVDRDKGLFTKGDPQLESEARRIAETVLVEGAIEGGILVTAEDNARLVLTNFLIGLGYTDVEVRFAG